MSHMLTASFKKLKLYEPLEKPTRVNINSKLNETKRMITLNNQEFGFWAWLNLYINAAVLALKSCEPLQSFHFLTEFINHGNK